MQLLSACVFMFLLCIISDQSSATDTNDEIDEMEAKIQALQTGYTELKKENEQLKAEQAESKKEVQVLENDYTELKKENKQLKIAQEESKKEVNTRFNQIETQYDQQNYSLIEVRRQSSKLKIEQEESKKEVQVLETGYTELKKENEQLKVEQAESKKEVNTRFNQIETQYDQQNYSLIEVRRQSSKLKIEQEETKKEVNTRFNQIETQYDQQNYSLIEVRRESSKIKVAQEETKKEVNKEYTELKKENKELKTEQEETTKEVNTRLDQIKKQYSQQNYSLIEVRRQSSKLSTYCKLLSADMCGPCNCLDDLTTPMKFYCDCQHLEVKRDCVEHYQYGNRISGMYTVHMNSMQKKMQVYCDQETDNGGWAVIQRRIDGTTNFYRNWDMYKNGFGKPHREFWMGNDNIHTLTTQSDPKGSEIRVDMTDWNDTNVYAKYDIFKMDGWKTQYAVRADGYSGNAGNSMQMTKYMKFSTYDQDNDDAVADCARTYRGAWWYKHCHESNLNGEYVWYDDKQPGFARGVIWRTYKGYSYSLKTVEMKVRRKI